MTRLLIANRGEIVTRIARTARRLGMSVVTISSPVDSHAQWHRLADHTVVLDGDIPSESYTNSDQIIAAALAADCDAVHPGYGFLSEDSDFAEAVVAAGLTFVGPAAESIALLGDKARAKKAAADAGIPTLTAWGEASADPDTVLGHVRSLDVPVLLKPVFGGGGKGMVRLHPGDDAREVITSAIGLNERNFGRGDLMIETLVERPRHIEVQVLLDSFGTGVHFFTRECSLQRRNQKIIEQAPASSVPESVLGAMQHDALRLLGGVGYVNAATVEFLVDAENRYYFLEVNTRLQVEHTVTEEVTGVDLVELQLDIALGARLPLQQRDIALRGFAVQARIYAEDPSNGFRPAPSHSVDVAWPSTVRIDSAFEGAGSIPPFYDPMIAKVIASGPTRSTALESLDRALADSSYFGGTSNIGFLRLLLATPAVRADDIHTSFVDEHLPRLIPDSAEPPGHRRCCCDGVDFRRGTIAGHRVVMDRPPRTTSRDIAQGGIRPDRTRTHCRRPRRADHGHLTTKQPLDCRRRRPEHFGGRQGRNRRSDTQPGRRWFDNHRWTPRSRHRYMGVRWWLDREGNRESLYSKGFRSQ